MTKEKNRWMLGILIISVFVLITSVSYALWSMTLQQESTNVITTGCFHIEFQDNNPIHLENAYPLTDEEGMNLTPYTFTITNTCDSYASYQVNLEELTTDLKRLPNEYIKIEIEGEVKKLKELEEVTTTIENADISHKIWEGVLEPKEVKTFSLKLWMDESTPVIDEVMNAIFESKISITSTYQNTIVVPYLDQVKASSIPNKEDKYEFERYECNNEVNLTWDNELWNYTLSNVKSGSTQNICKMYFKTITYEVVLYSEEATFEKNKVLTNLIQNGSFENDFEEWESVDWDKNNHQISSKSVSGKKSLYIHDESTLDAFWLRQNFKKDPKIGDVIYQAGYAEVKNTNDATYFFISYWENKDMALGAAVSRKPLTVTNEFVLFSQYYKIDVTKELHVQIGSGLAGTSEIYMDDIYAINLTDIFGSGNEPTQEWVDKYIPYFDTTANIAVESMEKLETKNFTFTLDREATVECTNAESRVENGTLIVSNAVDDVYCKIS